MGSSAPPEAARHRSDSDLCLAAGPAATLRAALRAVLGRARPVITAGRPYMATALS
jgi:hypothetical protein